MPEAFNDRCPHGFPLYPIGICESCHPNSAAAATRTYWNGEPARARRVIVEVGPAPAGWWCAPLLGQEREAVEVVYEGGPPFYLDNADGSGWWKVTEGRGSPRLGHKSVTVARVLREASHA